MIIIEVSDGLGNQMFQYAFARAWSIENNDTLFISKRMLKKDPVGRKYGLDHFALKESVDLVDLHALIYVRYIFKLIIGKILRILKINPQIINYYISYNKRGNFIPSYQRNKLNLYCGIYQSELFFQKHKDQIMKDFVLVDELTESEEVMQNRMKSGTAVCVHMRRGDYVNSPRHYVCDEEYYNKAIAKMRELRPGCHFYIFSDDMNWVKENYKSTDITYVDVGENEFSDLKLMSSCKHFIISNSTFSWWAQYLSTNEDKIVIAPNRWLNGINIKLDDIFQKNWTLIEV